MGTNTKQPNQTPKRNTFDILNLARSSFLTFWALLSYCGRWFSKGPEYAVSLLCKGMYGFEYLLKEVAMNYRTKVHNSEYHCLNS